MMKTSSIIVALALVGAGSSVASAKPAALKGGEYAAQAKVTLASARIAALKARPGTITDQELEKEKGGSGLRYSFDITSHGKPFEVGVDAKTGAILENAAEGKNPD
ncbi:MULTISPECIES: PepSY domain-containing protein [Sphingomonadaceae]|jgi:uncharacterized membrane protein YkoI|nr:MULTISPECIES: PepSY domain-containing protein [Sphingomonadaceae]MCC4257556.1 PepSY domain-containing protein [Sphingobium lactosutens]|tara:strand:- start:367 stop:684 length:318 start_codon:yes stop_codon:yes gene_type:complete